MIKNIKLSHGNFYHIYNRGNNKENLFFEEDNYIYFFKLYQTHISPIADTYAYCLLKNHFHFLVRIKMVEEIISSGLILESSLKKPSQYFSNFFNSYAKSINRKYNRTGSLFQERYQRKLVDSDEYFLNLIHYIHFNPQKHRFVDDFREWKFSSYHAILSEKPTKLNREKVLDWFCGQDEFMKYHTLKIEYEKKIGHLIGGD